MNTLKEYTFLIFGYNVRILVCRTFFEAKQYKPWIGAFGLTLNQAWITRSPIVFGVGYFWINIQSKKG